MAAYRITIVHIENKTIELTIEKTDDIIGTFGRRFLVVSRCRVKQPEDGITQYLPLPYEKDFGQFPKEIDKQITSVVHAYFDGLKVRTNYTWIL